MMRIVADLNSGCNMASMGGQGYCPYCVYFGKNPLRQMGRLEFNSLDGWAKVINNFEAGLVDFGLGEPLQNTMVYELINKINKKHKWAITTNGLNDLILSLFYESPPKNCANWTFSLHPHCVQSMNGILKKAVAFKRICGAVSINVVDWSDNVDRSKAAIEQAGNKGITVNVLPLAPKLGGKGSKSLDCKHGQKLVLINPDGRAYGCQTRHFMDLPFGDVFDCDFKLPKERTVCDLPCMPYYLGERNPCKGIFDLDIKEYAEN